ncbi:hypothetical protein BDV06DRAFT_214222 [Aspergillus oleicola]
MHPEYRSATEYSFDEEHSDAIIRTITYHRRELCRSAIWFPPRPSYVGLGFIYRLPRELLLDDLYGLNMDSLFKFRQVSSRSRQLVDSLSHLKRSCFRCLVKPPKTQVRFRGSVKRRSRMTKTESNELRSFESLAGTYCRFAIVSLYQATSIYNRKPPARQETDLLSSYRNQNTNLMGACALPYHDKEIGSVERGISCAGCQLDIEDESGLTIRVNWDANGEFEAQIETLSVV